MKKFLSVLLSVCMVLMCSVSAFAYTADASKTAISDQEMAGAVGGCSGYASTVVTSYSGNTGVVKATITNGISLVYTTGVTKYSLENIDPGTGAITQVIIPPTKAPTGTFTISGKSACVGYAPNVNCTARASIWNEAPSDPTTNYCAAVSAQSVRLSANTK